MLYTFYVFVYCDFTMCENNNDDDDDDDEIKMCKLRNLVSGVSVPDNELAVL